MSFPKGKSGNPSGRPSVTKAIRAAGFDPDELRVEVIQKCVEGIRSLDPGDKDESASWRFCVDKLAIWTGLPSKAREDGDERGALTQAEYEEELREIGHRYVTALTPEEKFRLLAVDPAPDGTVQ